MDENQGLIATGPEGNKPESVFAVTRWSYRWLKAEYSRLWADTYRPFVLVVVVGLLGILFNPESSPLMSPVVMILSIVSSALLAVATHRSVLLVTEGGTRGGPIVPSKRELKYVGYQLLLGLIFALPFMLLALLFGFAAERMNNAVGILAVIITVVAAVVAVLASLRLAFLYPAVAADRKTDIKTAWRESKGWVPQYILATLVFSLPLFAGIMVIGAPVALLGPEGLVWYYMIDAAWAALSAVWVWFAVVPLSIAYGVATGRFIESDFSIDV